MVASTLRAANHEQLEGGPREAGLRIIIARSSTEAAEAFLATDDFAPHLAERTSGSVSHHDLIEGKDDLA